MKRLFFGILLLLVYGSTHAIDFSTATVEQILEQSTTDVLGDITTPTQKILLRTSDGSQVRIDPAQYQIVTEHQLLAPGDRVVVGTGDGIQPLIADRYRLPAMGLATLAFVVIAWFVGKKHAFRSLIGLALSILILTAGLMPALLRGAPSLLSCVIAAIGITGVTIVISHGWRRRTGLAVAATFATLAIAFVISWIVVHTSQLSGLSSEQTYYLVTGIGGKFDLRGLLLGAIVLGIVGVLDDVTTTQVSTVEELSKANHYLTFDELWTRGMSVGHEHIASMINTLALAYIGAGLPLFLLASTTELPLWVQLNSEFFGTEIVRTIAGSCALLLGVPISTGIAAWHWSRR